MRHLDEYRDPASVLAAAASIRRRVTRTWRVMEVCGGQTHSFVRFGLEELLPSSLTLVHGPGCPVCVTPVEQIDRAVAIASRRSVIFCSFGDMLRVPGSEADLFRAKSEGGDVRVVYSPLDAVKLAAAHPDREVVFFAVGFETTAPVNALAVLEAERQALTNFSILVAHVRVPPALELILSSPDREVDGFLAAGHVCAVMGTEEYQELNRRFRVPIVVAGFEPLDLLLALSALVAQLEEGRAAVENAYARVVSPAGNETARAMVERVFEVRSQTWRGLGELAAGGLGLRSTYARYDAATRFEVGAISARESPECLSGQVLLGKLRPPECPAFGGACTPEHPLGAPMVSGEGACAAYYRYRGAGPGAR